MTFAPSGAVGVDPWTYGLPGRLVSPPVDLEIRNTGSGAVVIATIPIPVGINRWFDLHLWFSGVGEDGLGTGRHDGVGVHRNSAGAMSASPLTNFGQTSGNLKMSLTLLTDDIDVSITFSSSGDTDGDFRAMLFERPVPNVVIP